MKIRTLLAFVEAAGDYAYESRHSRADHKFNVALVRAWRAMGDAVEVSEHVAAHGRYLDYLETLTPEADALRAAAALCREIADAYHNYAIAIYEAYLGYDEIASRAA